MADHHLTAMPAETPLPVMPVLGLDPGKAGIQDTPIVVPAQTPLPVIPAQAGIRNTATVMPVKTGIHLSSAEHWIPACAAMTIGEHVDRCGAARREAARLAADARDMAQRRIPMTMQDWETRLNRFIEATDRSVLQDAGKVTAEIARAHAESEFEKYRIVQDRLFESDFDRLVKAAGRLEQTDRALEGKGRGKKK